MRANLYLDAVRPYAGYSTGCILECCRDQSVDEKGEGWDEEKGDKEQKFGYERCVW